MTYPTPDSLHAWPTYAKFLAVNNTKEVGTPPSKVLQVKLRGALLDKCS